MGSSSNQSIVSGATDDAVSVSGSTGTTVSKDGGIAIGQGAKLVTGLEVGAASGSTFNIGEAGLGATFAQTVKDLSEKNTAALANIVTNSSQSNLPKPSDVPAADLSQDKPGAVTLFDNWLLWAGIVAALGALWFFSRKR